MVQRSILLTIQRKGLQLGFLCYRQEIFPEMLVSATTSCTCFELDTQRIWYIFMMFGKTYRYCFGSDDKYSES